jgi:hypothetical protein
MQDSWSGIEHCILSGGNAHRRRVLVAAGAARRRRPAPGGCRPPPHEPPLRYRRTRVCPGTPPAPGSGSAAAASYAQVAHRRARLASRRACRAAARLRASSSGTAAPVTKYISSGVWPSNAACRSDRGAAGDLDGTDQPSVVECGGALGGHPAMVAESGRGDLAAARPR